jgi:hypothetical protein
MVIVSVRHRDGVKFSVRLRLELQMEYCKC